VAERRRVTGRTEAQSNVALRRLYREIHNCEKCILDPRCEMTADQDRMPRTLVSRAAVSPVFVIGQALGPNTQRLSGVPYTYPNRELSATGRVLDDLLRAIGHTIDARSDQPYVYSSDIVQRYPGAAARGDGDRTPTRAEMENCAEWLETELRIVRPRVIILLGKLASHHFLSSNGIRWRGTWGEPEFLTVDGQNTPAFPVYHPAYRRRKPDVVDDLYATVARRVRGMLRATR
jgi:uracil-DNA glycosylase